MSTQIFQHQIQDGAINDAKVQAGANIATSKLADGANFIKKDGSVVMTGSLDSGNQKILNVGTPTTSTDAANKSYVDTQIGNLNSLFDVKGSVKAASVGNITVSNPGTAIFDVVTLSVNDRLLLKDQTAPAENGIYQFNGSSSALTRVTDMDAWAEVPGAFVAVEQGSVNDNTIWLCTSNGGGTIGTTAITWLQIPTTAGLLGSNFITRETPSGAVDGVNVTYTLANTPYTGSEEIFLNGILQDVGAGNDYTISGATITMLVAPLTGEKIRVNYRK
mgnify:CR=1 FL=1